MPLDIYSRLDVNPHSRLTVVGVRHHSPACARLVGETIREKLPAFVLIEGPADFNPYLGDLRLSHELPVAIFSFYATTGQTRASYSPVLRVFARMGGAANCVGCGSRTSVL